MLLQTFLQLNILILATPALAGWSLLPPVHGVTGDVVSIVWHRTAKMPAPNAAAAVTETRQAKRLSVLPSPPVPLAADPAAAPRAVLVSLPLLPQAARAP